MPSYILRNIDPDAWAAFKSQAAKQGHPLRWLFLRFIAEYGTVKPLKPEAK